MKENDNDIAPFKGFKDKFEGHELPPDDSLWNAIDTNLALSDRRANKRKLIFWWSFTFLIIGLSVLFGKLYLSNNKSIYTDNPRKQNAPYSNEIKADSILNANNTIVETNNSKSSQFEIKSLIQPNGELTQKQLSIDTVSFKHSKKQSFNQEKSNTINFSGGFSVPNSKRNTAVKKSESKVDLNDQSNIQVPIVTPKNYFSIQVNKQVSSNEIVVNKLVPIDISKTLFFEKQITEVKRSNDLNTKNRTSQFVNTFFIRFGFSPSYTDHVLSNRKNQEPTLFDKKYFNSREVGMFNYNYSVDLGYQLNQRFSFKTGVGMVNYSTNFSSSNTPVEYDTINGELITYTSIGEIEFNETEFEENEDDDQSGTPEEELEEESEEIEDGEILLSYSSFQKISYIQIPLSVEIGMNRNKFRLYFNTGLTLNFVTAHQVDLTFDQIGLVRKSNSLPIRKFNLGSSLGIGIEYRVRKRIGVYFEPSFNYNFFDVNGVGSVKNKPFSLGTNLGFKIFF